MVTIEYANAYFEVLEILKCISEIEYKKIPQDLINVYTKNANINHEFNYDPNKTLNEQHTSKIAKAIIAILYRDYWATDEQREKIIAIQKNNRIEEERKKKENYEQKELFFKDKEIETVKEEKDTFLIKKTNKKWYERIIEVIKKILRK